MLSFFACSSVSALAKPVLNVTCSGENYFDTYSYDCSEITNVSSDVNFTDNVIKCDDGKIIDVSGDEIKCVENSTDNTENLVILDDERSFYVNSSAYFITADTITINGMSGQIKNLKMNETYQKFINDSTRICSSWKTSILPSCQALASACALLSYDPNSEFCSIFDNKIFDTRDHNVYEYEFWKEGLPFISYGTAKRAIEEDVLESDFTFNQIIEIQFARYSKEGDFKGFIKMKDQFKRCQNTKYINQIWRIYGSDVLDECKFNIKEYLDGEYTDFYEPFYVELVDGVKVLRPIPILNLNYVDESGEYVNQGTTIRVKRLFRRFFMFDDYLTEDYYQYLSNITLVFQTSGEYPLLPYIVVRYEAIPKSEIDNETVPIFDQLESKAMKDFTFKTTYITSLDDFWFSALVVVVVLSSLLFILYLYTAFISYQHYGQDGVNVYVIVQCVYMLFTIISILVSVLFMVFSFSVLIAYKWSGTTYMMLPEESVFSMLRFFVWFAFGTTGVAVFCKIFMMLSYNVLFIEWKPTKINGNTETYRKVQIAHEWEKLFTLRDYSIPFAIIVIVFLLNGLDLDYVSTPIQSNTLISTGTSSPVLRVPFLCLLWIALYLVQYAFFKIKGLIFGSPIDNFLSLCGSANISIFSLMSQSWGYYINGKPSIDNGDDSMQSIDESAIEEEEEEDIENQQKKKNKHAKGNRLTRLETYTNVLNETSDDVLFELYLAPHFRESFAKLYKDILAFIVTTKNTTAADPDSIIPEAMVNFTRMNSFLRKFFGAPTNNRDFDAYKEPLASSLFRMPPRIDQKSVFYAEKKRKFSRSLLAGMEWTLSLFEMLLFIGVDYELESATKAGFVTFFADFFIIYIIKLIGKRTIGKNSLIEKRFYHR